MPRDGTTSSMRTSTCGGRPLCWLVPHVILLILVSLHAVKAQTVNVSGSASLTDGDTTTLTCASTPAFTGVQWYKGGVVVSGATTASYTTPAVDMTNNGDVYLCNANVSGAPIESSTVTLTVVPKTPAITNSPAGDVTDGESASLICTTTTTISAAPMYVWIEDGQHGTPQSSNALVYTADLSSGVKYECKVSGDGGTAYSAGSAEFQPSVRAQTPTVSGTSSLTDGDTTTLTCSSASTPLTSAIYEWYKDGSEVSGATSNTYTTPAVAMSNDGDAYTCKVIVNTVTSLISTSGVTLTVVPKTPTVTSSPVGVVTDQSTVTLTCVTATTSLPSPKYVWTVDGSTKTAQTLSTWAFTVDINAVVAYTCKVSGDGGTDYSAVSSAFTPSVKAQTPSVSGSSSLTDGDTTTLTCSPTSTLTGATFEWYKDGSKVSGATSNTYTTPAVTMSNDDDVFTCKVIVNTVPSLISTPGVTLTVVPKTPTVTSSPSGTVTDGSSVTLTCATVSTSLSSAKYVWNVGGSDRSAQTSSDLIFTADITNVETYTCKVSGNGGTDYSAVSNSVTHSVRPQTPTVVGRSSLTDGDTTTLACSSASTLTGATFAWYLAGSVVTGATAVTYTTPAVTMSNDGDVYTCEVTMNTVTSVRSTPGVTLTVVPKTPTISSSPSGDVTDASSVTLTCATASTGLSSKIYVWNDGTDGSQTPTNTKTFTANINNVATYKCKVSGDGGTDFSSFSSPFTPSVRAQTPTVTGNSRLTDGDTTTLTCASASLPLSGATFEWSLRGTLVAGATSSPYTIPAVAMSNDGDAYTCKVVYRGVTSLPSSNTAILTVVPKTPTISGSPSGDVTDGSSVTLICATASLGLLSDTYVWNVDGSNQIAQAPNTLVYTANINSVSTYTCKVSGDGGTDYSAVSSAFTPSVRAKTPTVTVGGSSSLTDGDTATLTCSSASTPLTGATYEWYVNARSVSGAVSSTYTTPAVAMRNDNDAYTCKVVFSSVSSLVSSNSVTLSVVPATPTISRSPVTDASSVTLTCATTSTGLLDAKYVWTIGGAAQSPQTSSILPFTANINSGVVYTCKVSGDGGTDYSAVSASFTPTVIPITPTISSSPSGDVTDASSVTLTCATASGLSSKTYVWNDGTDRSPGPSDTLTFTANISTVATYKCKVSGDGGTDYSSFSLPFTPSVRAKTPTVSGSYSLTDGGTTTVTCSSASSPLTGATFEWYLAGGLVSGAVSSTYTTPAVAMSNDGDAYTCKVIFNGVTSLVSSNSGTLTVVPKTPTISSSPSGDVTDASSVTLTCATASTGLSSKTYVWNDGTDGSQTPTNTKTFTANINNVATYKCKVSGDGGTDFSSFSLPFTPSVRPQTPTVSGSSRLTDGDTTTLTCSSASTPLIGATFEWYMNTSPVFGAVSSTHTTPAVAMSNDGNAYTCKVIFNTVTSLISSNSATLTVVPKTPTISSSPSGVVTDMDVVNLTCATPSTGLSSAKYVWNIGGTDQTSQVSDTLAYTANITTVLPYTCKVSGDGGTDYSAVSPAFTPSVKAQTPTMSLISNLANGYERNMTCSSASTPLTGAIFEWYLNGSPVPGASSRTYTAPVVSDGDTYTCKVIFNNVNSSISSNSVTLTANLPPGVSQPLLIGAIVGGFAILGFICVAVVLVVCLRKRGKAKTSSSPKQKSRYDGKP